MDKETKKQKNIVPTIRRGIKEAILAPEVKSKFGLKTQTDAIRKTSEILDTINEQNERKKLRRLTFNNLISIYLGEEADKNVIESHSRTLRRQCKKMGILEFLNKVSGTGKRYIYQKRDLNFIRILHKEQQKNIVKAGVEAIIQWSQVSDILENLLEQAYANKYIKDDEEETLENQLKEAECKLWEYYELGPIPQDMGLMMDYGELLENILSMKDNPEELRKFLYSEDSKDSAQVSDSSKSQPMVDNSISFNEFARTQEAGISNSDKEKTLKIANRLYEIYKANKKNFKYLNFSGTEFLYKLSSKDSDNQSEIEIEELENCIARIKGALGEKKPTDIDEILLEWDYINALIRIFGRNEIKISDDLEEIIVDVKRIILSQILNKYAEWLSQKKYIRAQGNLYYRYMRINTEKMFESFKN